MTCYGFAGNLRTAERGPETTPRETVHVLGIVYEKRSGAPPGHAKRSLLKRFLQRNYARPRNLPQNVFTSSAFPRHHHFSISGPAIRQSVTSLRPEGSFIRCTFRTQIQAYAATRGDGQTPNIQTLFSGEQQRSFVVRVIMCVGTKHVGGARRIKHDDADSRLTPRSASIPGSNL